MTQLKSVHCDDQMQGRTAAHTVQVLSNLMNDGWKTEDSWAASDVSIEASSIIFSHPNNSFIWCLDSKLNCLSQTLSQGPVDMVLLPTSVFLSSAKSLLDFSTHPTAFGGDSNHKVLTDSQASLLAAVVNQLGVYQDHIRGGIGNERLVKDPRQTHRPTMFGLNFNQSFYQLFSKVMTLKVSMIF